MKTAGLSIAVCAFLMCGMTSCKRAQSSGQSNSNRGSGAGTVAEQKSRIITKDPEFTNLHHPPTGTAIPDDISSQLRACLERHRGGWFEIGHLSFSGSNTLAVSSVDASPIVLPSGTNISTDTATMTKVYSRFRELANGQIEEMGRSWVDDQSCHSKLRNVCENLGGSESECSTPAKLSEIEQSLPGVLAGVDCNDNASLEEGMQQAEDTMRSARIVMVGQGDLLSHRIDRLLIVDYDTETVLHELSPAVLPSQMSWKFPDDTHRGQFASSAYKISNDSDTQRDFGVVPIGQDWNPSQKQIAFNNTSDSPVSIAVSIDGDPHSNFELDNGCSSGSIDATDNCAVTVAFKPKDLGIQTATLSVIGNWPEHAVTLRGFGAWPWDIYRGEINAGTATVEVQPTAASDSDSEIRDAVAGWANAFRARDAEQFADCYASTVERLFGRRDVSQSRIRDIYQAAFGRIDAVNAYDISDLRIGFPDEPGDPSRATATYDKRWDTGQMDGKTDSGEEIERLTFEKADSGWKIVREEELRVIRSSRQ